MEETYDTLSTGGIRIVQPRKGYRFSLDSLILPFFLQLKDDSSIVEMGAGSGVVSMILAKRCPTCRFSSVEIQERLYALLSRNLELNDLQKRVRAVHGDIRKIDKYFGPEEAEQVCSNPPFRKVRAGRINPDPEKAMARHEITMTLEALVHAADYLLKRHGRFSLIYLPERLTELILALRKRNLEPRRMQTIHSFHDSPPVLLMMEAVKGARPGMKMEAPFVIYEDKAKTYSRAMKAIYEFQAE